MYNSCQVLGKASFAKFQARSCLIFFDVNPSISLWSLIWNLYGAKSSKQRFDKSEQQIFREAKIVTVGYESDQKEPHSFCEENMTRSDEVAQ